MADTKRCPHCGGLNPLTADWCGQCLERFTPKPTPAAAQAPPPVQAPPSPQAPVQEPAVDVEALLAGIAAGSPPPAAASPPPTPTPAPPGAAVGTTRGAFTVREHGVVWTCSSCDTENPLDQQMCSVCGTTFADVVSPPAERPERDPGTATLISLFFPGAGHGYLGLWGQAVARAVLHLWVLFVVFTSVRERGPGSASLAVLFGLAATGLWVTSAHDSYREARREPQQVLLKGRRFLFLVLGLLLLFMVLVVSSVLRARG